MFAWLFGSLNDHAYGPAVGRSLLLLTLMTSLVSGSFSEAAWKNGIAMTVIRFGSARLSVILSVRPLAETPAMLTALLSLMKGPAGELSVLFVARWMAYLKFFAVT